MDADTTTTITDYERRIAKLERDKLLKSEKLASGTVPQRPFEEMFELALAFLANPQKLWASNRFEDKRTVLKLTFDDRLAYSRNKGLRTPKTTSPFSMLEEFSMEKCKMAEREGFEPPGRCRPTVFKTAAFDHSAISPLRLLWCIKGGKSTAFCISQTPG